LVPNYGGYNIEPRSVPTTSSPAMTAPGQGQNNPVPPVPGASAEKQTRSPRTRSSLIPSPQPRRSPVAPASSVIRSGGRSVNSTTKGSQRVESLFRIGSRLPLPRKIFRSPDSSGTVPPQRPVELRDTRSGRTRSATGRTWRPTSAASRRSASGPGLIEPTPGLIKPDSSVTPPGN